MGTRRNFDLRSTAAWLLAALLLASAPVADAACERTYTIGFSQSGTFAYTDNGELKGLIPRLVREVERRTGCKFDLQDTPRARMWMQWEAGTIDILSGAVRTPERDLRGSWTAFGFVEEVLISPTPPPGKTLEGWLNLPQRPVLGRIRSAMSGSAVDELLARTEFASQVEAAMDSSSLVRKIFARRNAGVLQSRPAFDSLAKELGFDPSRMTSFPVDECARVPYGFYFQSTLVKSADQRLLIATFEQLLKSGFNEAAYAETVGNAVAAQIYRDK